VKYFNFLSLALIVGFISSSAIDTKKRLQKIEKQQSEAIAQASKNVTELRLAISAANFSANESAKYAEQANELLKITNQKLRDINFAIEQSNREIQFLEKSLEPKPVIPLTAKQRTGALIMPPPPVIESTPKIGESKRELDREAEQFKTKRTMERIADELLIDRIHRQTR
jgi:hypothetical protein